MDILKELVVGINMRASRKMPGASLKAATGQGRQPFIE